MKTLDVDTANQHLRTLLYALSKWARDCRCECDACGVLVNTHIRVKGGYRDDESAKHRRTADNCL